MASNSESSDPPAKSAMTPQHLRRRKRWRTFFGLLAVWGAAAYLLAPWLWKVYFHHHATFADAPHVTHTADGHPGDPLNIALVGSEAQVIRAMTAAGWFPADPLTFRSSVRIAVDSVFRRPDTNAPVSNLYLFGRKQDLAFEQPAGNSPRQRHHVRFWHWDKEEEGRSVWFGSATFDERVGLSYTTGQVTHHIGPDVDAERDRIASELKKADWVQEMYWVDGFHRELAGRNGGGDPWHTDGRLAVVALADRLNPSAPGTNSVAQP